MNLNGENECRFLWNFFIVGRGRLRPHFFIFVFYFAKKEKAGSNLCYYLLKKIKEGFEYV